MTLVAVPNVSEGRDAPFLNGLQAALSATGVRTLDVHSDGVHNRSVFTLAGSDDQLIDGAVELARRCLTIDLTSHRGLHPRLGGLDVCPFVPINSELDHAIDVARRAGSAVSEQTALPVYLYEAAATRPETRSLPSLRKGGLEQLARRANDGLTPDYGPKEIDPESGVVCVGARRPLIAFNVVLRSDEAMARQIAAGIRTANGGPPGVRAFGWALGPALAQVSMNLIEPEITGIDDVFPLISSEANAAGVLVEGTEIVGLPPEKLMPDPQKEAARLLIRPGRSLESVLRR